MISLLTCYSANSNDIPDMVWVFESARNWEFDSRYVAPSEENDKLSIDNITQNYNLPGFKSSVFLNIQHCYVGIKADNAQNVLSLSENNIFNFT